MANIALSFIAFNLVIALANGIPPIVPLGGIGAAISYGLYASRCIVQECCTDRWISPNIPKLYYDLNQRVHGQHLVSDIVFKAIKGHLSNKSPKKALTLSFNGMRGTGKNLVSRIIAENIFANGMKSKFVKLIIATHDFKHKKDIENNKLKLEKWIVDKVTECPLRSMFIIDEMDKMSEGLIDVLKPFLSHYQVVDGVDYRKAIFIFMGNTGAELINKETILNKQSKKKREDITIKQMDNILSNEALKKVGGFLHASLLEHKLIDYFVPFLPLEKSHVRQCVEDDLKEKNIAVTDEVIKRVVDELEYFPGDSQWFSESGCKKVSTKVDQIIG
jgi:hypothetical protein